MGFFAEMLLWALTIPLIGWIFKPFNKPEEEQQKIAINNPPKEAKKNVMFRPTTFDEYIGQDKVKNILKRYIKATQDRKTIFPHTLLYAKPGYGKTTLARILATELDVPIIEFITSELYMFDDFKLNHLYLYIQNFSQVAFAPAVKVVLYVNVNFSL